MVERRFYEASTAGARRSAPAATRNREPIAEVLQDWLPASGLVLEIASGTGEHVIHFAERFPSLEWQPSDTHDAALQSIAAWRGESGLSNVRPPLALDVTVPWQIGRADAVLNINMVHISPWRASLALIEGSASILSDGAPLILYGPWLSDDVETAGSNLAFDAQLKSVDPSWGLRRLETFAEQAAVKGFRLDDRREMPANNVMLLFRRVES